MQPPEVPARLPDLVLHADLRPCPAGAHLRLARRGLPPSPSSSMPTWRRCVPATPRSPTSPHADPPAVPAPGTSAWTSSARRFPTAVLSLVSPDGFPFALRVPVSVDRDARRIRHRRRALGRARAAGLACLTAHEHAPDFTWQPNFQVRGDLVEDGDGWSLVPAKLVGGFELPPGSRARHAPAELGKAMRFRRIADATSATGTRGAEPGRAAHGRRDRTDRRPRARRRRRARALAGRQAHRGHGPPALRPRRSRLAQDRVPPGRRDRRAAACSDLVKGADVVVHLAFAILGAGEDAAELNVEGSRQRVRGGGQGRRASASSTRRASPPTASTTTTPTG